MRDEPSAEAEVVEGVEVAVMRLYRVTNGFQGNGDVHVLVIAADEAAANGMAAAMFAYDSNNFYASKPRYPETYAARDRMQAELLCDDVTQPWASEVWA